MEFLNKIVERFIRANRKMKRWQRAVSILAAVVVFATTYAFVLPAITLDKETAAAQSGIEIAASDTEPDSDGTVYEEEPQEEADKPQTDEAEDLQENESEGPQDAEAVTENSGSQSESQDAQVSEEDNSDEDTEAVGAQYTDEQADSEETEDSSEDEAIAPGEAEDEAPTTEILTEGETVDEIKLITEDTQLIYEYVDEEYENGIEDENDDGIDDGYFVYAEFGADAKLPEGVELSAKEITKESDPEAYEAYCEKALSGLQDKYDENTALSFAKFYDIKFIYNGEEVEPSGDVKVRIEYKKAVEIEKETNVDAVHFDKNNDEEPEVIESEINKSETAAEKKDEDDTVKTVEFESDRFSVYGVIGSYTVDFHWEVNGKMYEFTLPGGGFVSFSQLVEVLGISSTTNHSSSDGRDETIASENGDGNGNPSVYNQKAMLLKQDGAGISEKTRKFVADVEKVEFSNPALVDISKVENEATVGELKESRGLEVQYSAELTEEQIEEINRTVVESGDWALLSIRPFESEENLTVTMKTGEVFVVRVTDYQISTSVLTADGQTFKITVTYDDEAGIPDGSYLEAKEILPENELYNGLLSDSAVALRTLPEGIKHIRFFDITIWNNQKIIEPQKAVTVEICYQDPVNCDGSQNFDVVHFGNNGTEILTPVVKINEEAQTAQKFSFQTESFSTFAIAAVPTAIDQLIGNQYVLYISANNGNAVLSPEAHTIYRRLKAIPAEVTNNGTRITVDVDELPVWTVENGSQNNTYRLSTIYNGQKQYIRFDNVNGDDTDGHLWLSPDPQDLRIQTRNGQNGGTEFRFTYDTDTNERALDLFDNGTPSAGFSVYQGGSSNNNEYFNLYSIRELTPNKVTVHFVDRKGTLLTDVTYTGNNSNVTKNVDGTFTILYDWNNSTGTVQLDSEFRKTRYTYANTHLAKNTTTAEWPSNYTYTFDGIIIEPTLTSTGHALQFKTDIGSSGTGEGQVQSHDFYGAFEAAPPNGNNREYAAEGDKDVYVIMDPTPVTGGTGGSGGSGSDPLFNVDPVFHKDLANNHDGTYELSLSVVGKSLNEAETPKVNVLLVVDTSSSMVNSNNNVNYENDEGNTVNGTRLAATQVQLRKLGQQLLGRNNPNDSNKKDIVELAMVTFDGEPHPNTLDWTSSYDEFKTAVNNLTTHRGTDWEDALDAALVKANAMKTLQPNEPVYVLFFTDGEPSQYRNFHYTDDNDNGWRYFFAQYGKEASKDEVRAMVNNGIQLYTMFAFGPTAANQPTYYGDTQFQLLHKLVQYAYNTDNNLENTRAFNATNSTVLNSAFDTILKEINKSLGITDVVMNDSFTDLTVAGINRVNAGVTSTGGFRYWTIPAGGTWENRVEWINPPKADIVNGSVKWNLGSTVLQNNVTYVLTFTVWPSQEAYDWVADLNNGVKTWADVEAANLQNQIYRVYNDNNEVVGYEVQTNPESTVPENGQTGVNGISYTKTTQETVKTPGVDSERTYTTTTNPKAYVHETTTYTDNGDGTWTKKVESKVVTAFNMPDKRMMLEDTDSYVDKYWDVKGKLTELHNFLYHKDDNGQWVSNEKQICFKIMKGYDTNGKPAPYDKYGTDGLLLGWQQALNDYDWTGETTNIEGHKIGTRWREKLNISFGLMLTETQFVARGLDPSNTDYKSTIYNGVKYYLLDYGWDYAIDEIIGLNYQFDYRTNVYHPMLIDGNPADVKFAVNEQTGEWTITEMSKDLTALTGNNILRGDLRVQKELRDIFGKKVNDDNTTMFDFTIHLTNNDAVFIPDEGVETVPWYGVWKTTEVDGHQVTQSYFYQYAPGGVFHHYATEAEATTVLPNGDRQLKEGYAGNIMQEGGTSKQVTYNGFTYTGYTEATATLHVKPEEDWSISNIPIDTKVTVSEPYRDGYIFVNAKLGSGSTLDTVKADDGTVTTEEIEVPAGETTVIKITNQQLPILELLKISNADMNERLEGVEFKLYTDEACTDAKQVLRNADDEMIGGNEDGIITTGATNDDQGIPSASFGRLGAGTYWLKETVVNDGYIPMTNPVKITVNQDGSVSYVQSSYNPSSSGEGLYKKYKKTNDDQSSTEPEYKYVQSTDTTTDVTGYTLIGYRITVNNTYGYELPKTGGPGTNLFYLFGSILILGAGVLLWRRRILI